MVIRVDQIHCYVCGTAFGVNGGVTKVDNYLTDFEDDRV